MNYRHGFHAGNFADVFKHVLLRQLVRAMQRKPKPFLYLDTHAGRGRYDLARGAEGRLPEWPDGIGRLWDLPDAPAPVAEYIAAVRACNERHGAGGATPRYYPGSPWFVAELRRRDDRLALCELQPDEARALAREFDGARKVRVHPIDGYTGVRAMLPPLERRALVLLDPPFEAADEWSHILRAVEDGLARLPAAVMAVWYPLTARSGAEELRGRLRGLTLPPTLAAEIRLGLGADAPGLTGCGLLVLNPPWQIEHEFGPAAAYLASVLGAEPGATARIEWIVAEST